MEPIIQPGVRMKGYPMEENLKIERVGVFGTGLQQRCVCHELMQGVSCRIAPFVLKIQLESGFEKMEWNPYLNAVSVASVFLCCSPHPIPS